jgi:hypothetical protein
VDEGLYESHSMHECSKLNDSCNACILLNHSKGINYGILLDLGFVISQLLAR